MKKEFKGVSENNIEELESVLDREINNILTRKKRMGIKGHNENENFKIMDVWYKTLLGSEKAHLHFDLNCDGYNGFLEMRDSDYKLLKPKIDKYLNP